MKIDRRQRRQKHWQNHRNSNSHEMTKVPYGIVRLEDMLKINEMKFHRHSHQLKIRRITRMMQF